MPAICFDCGDEGHIRSECPNTAFTSGTGSTWCGFCDERTRLIDLGDKMRRCGDCHPLRDAPAARAAGRPGQHKLAQHGVCPACRQVVYEWDHAPCDKHHEVGRHRETAGWESAEQPPARFLPELEGAAVDQLADALRRAQEPVERALVTPEREAALRAMALQQVADSRRRRHVI